MTSSPTLSVSIMAHPSRREQALALVNRFQVCPARVVFDPEPSGAPSTIRTARLAWTPWIPTATHHLVLQDDVLLHDEFESQVLAAVAAQNSAVLSFFSEWGSFTSHAIRLASLSGHSWVRQPDAYLATQAAAMPTLAAHEFSSTLAATNLDVPDDHAIWRFANSSGIEHLVSVPNLVEHDVSDSLVGNEVQGRRRASAYVSDQPAPAGWWSRVPLTSVKRLPAAHWTTCEAVSYEKDHDDQQWMIRPRLRPWAKLSGEVEQLVQRATDQVVLTERDPVLRAGVKSVVNTLVDLQAVAYAVTWSELDTFADSCRLSAISTIIPGCLRRLERQANIHIDPQTSLAVLNDLLEQTEQLLPELAREALLATHFEASESQR